METVLKEGKNILIALRHTAIDINNPFTVRQRRKKIKKELVDWIEKGQVKIILIPDITEVCYGRGVGYGIREIRLDADIEKISATKIRKKTI